MNSFLKITLAIAAAVLAIFVYNIVTFTSLQCEVKPHDDHFHFPSATTSMEFAKRLSHVIQIPTISHEDHSLTNFTTFEELHGALRKFFPLAFHYLQPKVINKHSLLFKWDGQDKDKKPILLYAHLDVVPVDDASEWQYPPFEGRIADGFIWGRGSLDTKHQVMGIMEGTEALLSQQYKPQRTIYIAFGHDEEVQGTMGAKQIAQHLKNEGVTFEYILDEGMTILKPPIFPGLDKRVAVIGIAEKGYLTLEVSINGTGGHASLPPKHTAIGELSAAITQLENNPHPPSLLGAGAMLDFIGREVSYPMKAILANLWLFKHALYNVFSKKNTLNSLIRTTTAVTIIEGGIKANVLPKFVRAVVNHRVAPHQTIQDVIDHDTKAIDNPNINIKVLAQLPPSPISDPHAYGFQVIQHTILELFDDTVVAPGLMVANTDSRWFWDLSPNIYRFSPAIMDQDDLARLHGRNERIRVDEYKQLIEFYYHLIRNSDSSHIN